MGNGQPGVRGRVVGIELDGGSECRDSARDFRS
jgi:hypothetical protein